MNVKLVSKAPASCSPAEFGAFVAFVRAGGEVSVQGLAELIREAPALVFAYSEGALVGVSALKAPRSSYRIRVSKGSGVQLLAGAYPFELGWVYVAPNSRRHGVSSKLSEEALAARPDAGVFATTRTDNEAMQRVLQKLGFQMSGSPFLSGRGKHNIQVFVRNAAQPALQADSPAARTLGGL